MNAEVKEKWLEALRSGEYSQAKEQLAKDGGHCCLGVLCEVAIKQGAIKDYDPNRAYLPWEVQEWAGLDSDLPSLSRPQVEREGDEAAYQENELAVLNDGGTPFTEIADLIEKYL